MITNNGGENKATFYIFVLIVLYYVVLVLGGTEEPARLRGACRARPKKNCVKLDNQ